MQCALGYHDYKPIDTVQMIPYVDDTGIKTPKAYLYRCSQCRDEKYVYVHEE